MTLLETVMLGIGLAMDAVAVSMTNGMIYKNIKTRYYVAMIAMFAIFQGIMPLLGYFAGGLFATILEKYAGIVILAILGIIGGKMVYEGIKADDDESESVQNITLWLIVLQAIATSIDAFAVGIAFTAMKVNILPAVSIIAIVTGVCVAFAICIGKKAGNLLGSKAEILGGLILIAIGIKANF